MLSSPKRIVCLSLAVCLLLSVLASCAAPSASAETTGDAEEEEIVLPPAEPAIGVGRVMPEVVKERDRLICIDPGHGFIDGGSGYGFFPDELSEKDITLVVSNYLKEELEARGFQTMMTHDGTTIPAGADTNGDGLYSSYERPPYVNQFDIDYFVSIHTNALDNNPGPCGAIVFYNKSSSAKINDWNEPAAEEIALAIDEMVAITAPTRTKNPLNDDHADFVVTRDTKAAASLIELGYATNEYDVKNLVDPEWQRSIAAAIATGIERFFDKLEAGEYA